MNKEYKDKWLAALRSGDYKQGQHNLRDSNDRYCCLGVLCDIVDPNGWAKTPGRWEYGSEGDKSASGLTMKVMEITGVGSSLGQYRHNLSWSTFSSHRSLSAHNDNGDSFEKIANIIEENF